MLNYQRVTRFYWHGWYRSQHSSQAQVAVSTVALSAAVTACEGMGQWELALHLFFQNSIGLSCSGMEIRFPGTKGRYPPLGLTVDHGIPWHTMAYHGPRWESGRHFGELCHSRSRKGWPLGFGQWPQLNGHLLGKMRNQCVKGYHGLPYFGHIWTPYLWNFFHWYNHWGPGTSWRVWAEEAKENGVWAAFWEKESGNVGPAA